MLNHERERKNKENANFVHIVYLLAKLCNIFDEAFFIDVSICRSAFFDIHLYWNYCYKNFKGKTESLTTSKIKRVEDELFLLIFSTRPLTDL